MLKNPNSGSSAAAKLKLTSNGGNSLIYRTSSNYGYGIPNCLVIQNAEAPADTVFWMHGGGEVMRVTNTGKIGVGRTDRLSRFTIAGKTAFSATGTVGKTSGQNYLTGTNTKFIEEIGIGDRISVPGGKIEIKTVTAVHEDLLYVDSDWENSATGQTAVVKPSPFRIEDNANNVLLVISDDGKIGIGTASPGANVLVMRVSKSVTSVDSVDNQNHAIKLSPTMNAHRSDYILNATTISPIFGNAYPDYPDQTTKNCLYIAPASSSNFKRIKGINIELSNGDSNSDAIFIDTLSAANGVNCACRGSGTAIIGKGEGGEIGGYFESNNDNNFALKTGIGKVSFGGNVGIGTTDPGSKLEVSGGDIKIRTSAKGVIMTNCAVTKRVRLNAAGKRL